MTERSTLTRRSLLKQASAASLTLMASGWYSTVAARAARGPGTLTPSRVATYQALIEALAEEPASGVHSAGAERATEELIAMYAGASADERTTVNAALDAVQADGRGEASAPVQRIARLREIARRADGDLSLLVHVAVGLATAPFLSSEMESARSSPALALVG